MTTLDTANDSLYLDPRLPERFWLKTARDEATDCWIWIAARVDDRYGQFGVSSGRTVPAHRHTYQTLIGPITRGVQLRNTCGHSLCCNPTHYRVVSWPVATTAAGGI